VENAGILFIFVFVNVESILMQQALGTLVDLAASLEQ
jgi:hypothetical protein